MRPTSAGKLEAASRVPSDVQLQLQQAQQQNQTLARILAERCEQAAAHVEDQHQLRGVWQQLVDMRAVPSGATVQVSTCFCCFRDKAACELSLCSASLKSGSHDQASNDPSVNKL